MPQNVNIHADPSDMDDTMVYNLLHEVRKLYVALSQFLFTLSYLSF